LSVRLSVVVPVYNGAGTVAALVSGLAPVLQAAAAEYEIILVNDGSRDASWRVIEEQMGRHGWVRGINLMRNYGQHNALLCGIRAAHYEIVVTMDDDLQHPPEEVPKLLAELAAGHDVVYGTPEREQHAPWRAATSSLTKLALRTVMGVEDARKVSAFRAFRAEIREAFADFRGPFVSIDVLLTWGARDFSAVSVRHDPRQAGRSNYSVTKLAAHALNMITGFSTLPLRLASLGGFAATLFGVGVFVFVVGRYLWRGDSVPGFPFLAAVIAIFSGVQLFALGVLGEYVARMHYRMMERPSYTVRPSAGRPPTAPE
jgi:undecaprenyl-phosphate 4-deoxy-4-formamido-L-arabinose transferase